MAAPPARRAASARGRVERAAISRRLLSPVLLLGGLLLAGPGHGADEEGQFGIRGAGLVPCALFEQEREARSEAYHMIAGWLDGYITGTNQHMDDTYDVASFESTELVVALLSEHCKTHPETPVFAVINTLVPQFADHRLHAPSEKVEIAIGERRALLYVETVRRVQRMLTAAGIYVGETSGVYDAELEAAMRTFQESIGLHPTGFPDQLTLWRLFNEGPAARGTE